VISMEGVDEEGVEVETLAEHPEVIRQEEIVEEDMETNAQRLSFHHRRVKLMSDLLTTTVLADSPD